MLVMDHYVTITTDWISSVVVMDCSVTLTTDGISSYANDGPFYDNNYRLDILIC